MQIRNNGKTFLVDSMAFRKKSGRYQKAQFLIKKLNIYCKTNRSSHPEVFCKKGVFEKFAKFTSNCLDKIADLKTLSFLKM